MRRYAIARSLFAPTTLARAVKKLGFVQAGPIRAPARAQDLILRHRVRGYHAGQLEQRYPKLEPRVERAEPEVLVARIRAVWQRAHLLCPPNPPRGVQRFASIEEAGEARTRATLARMRATGRRA